MHQNLNFLKLLLNLAGLALDISKAILSHNIDLENKLKADFNRLKLEKDNLLKSIKIPKRCFRAII